MPEGHPFSLHLRVTARGRPHADREGVVGVCAQVVAKAAKFGASLRA